MSHLARSADISILILELDCSARVFDCAANDRVFSLTAQSDSNRWCCQCCADLKVSADNQFYFTSFGFPLATIAINAVTRLVGSDGRCSRFSRCCKSWTAFTAAIVRACIAAAIEKHSAHCCRSLLVAGDLPRAGECARTRRAAQLAAAVRAKHYARSQRTRHVRWCIVRVDLLSCLLVGKLDLLFILICCC